MQYTIYLHFREIIVPLPRHQLVNTSVTPFYHVMSRCVRRSFLCGKDHISGKDYSYRRAWIEKRLLLLANAFSINICSYSIMSNHFHIVLHLDETKAKNFNHDEVASRWLMVYPGDKMLRGFLQRDNSLVNNEQTTLLKKRIEDLRLRLCNLGWFMKSLNEYIAKRANFEDSVSGHFWESRYVSQALITYKALFSCMTYVDLNPTKAGLSQELEDYPYTSIYRRLKYRRFDRQIQLAPFSEFNEKSVLPISFESYYLLLKKAKRRASLSFDSNYEEKKRKTSTENSFWKNAFRRIQLNEVTLLNSAIPSFDSSVDKQLQLKNAVNEYWISREGGIKSH